MTNNLLHLASKLRRAQAAESLLCFTRFYLSEHVRWNPSAAHKEIYTILDGLDRKRGEKLAVAAPRGFGKSTLVTLAHLLRGICYGRERFIVIVSGTASQAVQFLGTVKRELEENEKLLTDFPELRGPKPTPWTCTELVTPTHIRVLALGTGQRLRGRRHGKDRPTLIIGDDLEDAERTFSLAAREQLKNWFNRSILKAGSEVTNYVFLGTLYHPYCLLSEYVDPAVHPEWIKRTYKAVLSWSKHSELLAQFSQIYSGRQDWKGQRGPAGAKAFYDEQRAAIEEGVELLWPERWGYYDLLVEREEDPLSFSSERQNEPLDPRLCTFNLEEYRFWDDEFGSVEKLLRALEGHVEFYAACDPSLGLDTVRGDYTAILILARDTRDRMLYVIVADIERYTPAQAINALFVYNQRYRFQTLVIETNQFQELMAQEVERHGREIGVCLPIKRVKHSGNKISRIQVLQPWLKNQMVQLSRAQKLLLDQLRVFPKGKHDDGPDALEMAVQEAQQLQEVELTIVGGDSEPWWRDYERNLGWKIF